VQHKVRTAFSHVSGFFGRQKRNYRVGVTRASANAFLSGLTSQYNSIYAVSLGAESVQLGALTSIASAISTLISIPVGWLVDRKGIKLFALLGVVASAAGVLLYAVAHDWRLLVFSAVLASVSMRLSGTGSSVICADSVQNKDRVTAQNLCGTLSGIVSMLSPLIGAFLITRFGGMTTEGMRPLYYVQFVGYGLVFLLVASQLREPKRVLLEGTHRADFLADFGDLFRGERQLFRWAALAATTALPMAMF